MPPPPPYGYQPPYPPPAPYAQPGYGYPHQRLQNDQLLGNEISSSCGLLVS